jgi:hypothetical protein
MAGGPQRCEKHQQVHCMKCWKEKETLRAPAPTETGSVRDRLPAAERAPAPTPVVAAPAPVSVGAFDPPGDIEGFDAGGPPNISKASLDRNDDQPFAQDVRVVPSSARTIYVEKPTESPEITDFVAAARRHALATKNLKDLLAGIKAAKVEKKAATAEFKKLLNPGRGSMGPRVKKPRKARTSSPADSKPA